MGRPKGSKNKPKTETKTTFSRDVIRRLWQEVPIRSWMGIYSRCNQSGKWHIENGNILAGRCPFHDDTDPSLKLNFATGFGKCFGCGQVVRDPVYLYAKLSNQSYNAALLDLMVSLDLKKIVGDQSGNLTDYQKLQEMKIAAVNATRAVVNEYIREKPEHLSYLEPALRYLSIGRKISIDRLSGNLPVLILAKPLHVQKYMQDEELYKLYEKYFKVPKESYYGSVCFYYNSDPNIISRFKLRLKNQNADELCAEKTAEQMNELEAKSLIDKDFYILKDPYAENMGIFGLNYYTRFLAKKQANTYITEGEFDALSVMVNQDDFIILATGGSGGKGLSFLREYGIRDLWIIQDSLQKNGDKYAISILANQKNFENDPVNMQLSFKFFTWPNEMRGADLDEAVRLMGYWSVNKYIYHERNSFFKNAFSWVKDNCSEAINIEKCKYNALIEKAENDNERENLKNELNNNLYSIVTEWDNAIKHSTCDENEFRKVFANEYGINISPRRDQQQGEINGYMQQTLIDMFNKYMAIVYYEKGKAAGGLRYTAWGKLTHDTFELPTQERLLRNVLSTHFNAELYDLIDSTFYNLDFYEKDDTDSEITRISKRNKAVAECVNEVISKMVVHAISRDDLMGVGQGIHYRDLGEGNQDVYLVNGEDVYRGTYTGNESVPVEWEYINNIVDKKFIFHLNKRTKWSDIKDASDLYGVPALDVQEIFKDILRALDGWKFEDHEFTRNYLAAWILSLPIQRAIGHVNIVFVNGPSSSGKTSFVRGLLGGTLTGTSFEVPSIIEGSWFSSDATAASIYQEMDQSALTLCLDEAESNNDDSSHTVRVKEIFDMLYSLSFGGAKMDRGGVHADQRTKYVIQMPVVLSAIKMSSDPVFLSRVVPIYTQKEDSHKNVGLYIRENFNLPDIYRLRKNITMCMLDKIPQLCNRVEVIRNLLSKVDTGDLKVNDRFVTIQLPILVVLDYLGFDVAEVYKHFIETRRSLIENVNSLDTQNELIDAIMTPMCINTSFEDTSSAKVSAKELIKRGDYDTLNNSDTGIKVVPDKRWIVFFWRDIKHIVLSHGQFAGRSETQCRELISKNKYLLNLTRTEQKYLLKSVNYPEIRNPTDYSVISFDYILDPSNDGVRAMEDNDAEFFNGHEDVLCSNGASGVNDVVCGSDNNNENDIVGVDFSL